MGVLVFEINCVLGFDFEGIASVRCHITRMT